MFIYLENIAFSCRLQIFFRNEKICDSFLFIPILVDIPFSCTVCDRFGGMKMLSTLKIWLYIPRKRWIQYKTTYFNMIIMWYKNVHENPMLTVIWQNISTKIGIKRKLSHIFHSEKRFEIYKKKQYFQDILTIFLIFFLHFCQHFKIIYVFLNIQHQFKKN